MEIGNGYELIFIELIDIVQRKSNIAVEAAQNGNRMLALK